MLSRRGFFTSLLALVSLPKNVLRNPCQEIVLGQTVMLRLMQDPERCVKWPKTVEWKS